MGFMSEVTGIAVFRWQKALGSDCEALQAAQGGLSQVSFNKNRTQTHWYFQCFMHGNLNYTKSKVDYNWERQLIHML